ncbi:hypothetical protein DH2020_046769 [Rehmannia glutinosa]|uniref:Inositol-tetrakisphosphate 1-kinase n=1 Tax=Rehmannia glutinosa TaxID=99300 RepID=A0ABR0UAP0_REHGL
MEDPMGRRFAVGYALASKKQASFIQISLINVAKEKSIDLIKIDLEKPLIEQGPFDLVLHKIYGAEWRQQLAEYSVKNPKVLIIDSPDAIERLHNRISMLQVVTDGEMDLESEGLKFPVIAKPLVADGSAKSHKMSLVYNSDGLSKLKPPVVLQEFVNHGGVIFKVYVVGEYVKCVKRKSLPDVNEENLGTLKGSLSFSRDTRVGNRYLVIDINYFPGYAKMPSYEHVLTEFFWDVLNNNDKKDVNSDGLSCCEKEIRMLVSNAGCDEDDGASNLPIPPVI